MVRRWFSYKRDPLQAAAMVWQKEAGVERQTKVRLKEIRPTRYGIACYTTVSSVQYSNFPVNGINRPFSDTHSGVSVCLCSTLQDNLDIRVPAWCHATPSTNSSSGMFILIL